MAVLAPRKRVVDTFPNKELAKATPPLIKDTDTYRALRGEKIRKEIIGKPVNVEFQNAYKKYLKMLD